MGNGKRHQTDTALHVERANSDQHFAVGNMTPEEDALVALLRDRVEQTLQQAREAEDARREPGVDLAPIVLQRRTEDATIQTERDVEDCTLEAAREKRRQTFKALLWAERTRTDASLLAERRHADRTHTNREDALAVAIHDLSSLLASVELNVLAIIGQAADAQIPPQRLAANIQNAIAVMHRLLGNIADASGFARGELGLQVAPHDARALVREVGEVFLPVAHAAGVTLDVDAGEAPLTATFDHDRVLRVLANLLTNALKFTPKGGRVWLRVRPGPDHLRFEVEDTGPGVPEEHRADIFEKFWRQQDTPGRGTGLGLYIARSIIEAHGGVIEVTRAEGHGATFFFTLPA